MSKRAITISLVSISIGFLALADRCRADIPVNVNQAKAAVFSLIDSNNLTAADSAVQKMITDFSARAGLDEALVQIVGKYCDVKQHQRAINLGRQVTSGWPSSKQAVWAQMHIIMANLDLGNETSVGVEVNNLSSKYTADPNLPWALYLVGEQYRWANKYANATALYQKIIQQSPASPYAQKARLAIARADILSQVQAGAYNQAQAATSKLVADFASHSDTAESLCDIAQQYSWMRQYDEAQKLCQQVVQSYPGSAVAARAQKCIQKTQQVKNNIFTLIDAGNYKEAQNNVDKLMADFGDEPDVPAVLYHIASKLEEKGRYGEASYVYEQIIWRYPTDAQAENARLDVRRMTVLILAELGRDVEARQELTRLTVDFNNHPYLPVAVVLIAEGFYRKARQLFADGAVAKGKEQYQNAVDIFRIVTDQLPSSPMVTPNAYYFAGESYRALGEYHKSAECFQKLIDAYPQYDFAWNALYLIGDSYQNLGNSGLVAKPEADSKTEEAYKKLCERYPACAVAGVARRWLDGHSSK